MTDRRDPDELIEIASAYIDGEATADELELVGRDPELQQVVAALEANRVRVSDAPAEIVDPLDRPAHLAEAMAVFDELHPPVSRPRPVAAFEPPRPAPPQDLSAIAAAVTGKAYSEPDAAKLTTDPLDLTAPVGAGDSASMIDRGTPIDLRAERSRRRSGPPAWLAAAAGLVVVAGGAAFLANRAGGGEDSAAETAGERVSASSTNDASAAEGSEVADMADDSSADAMEAPTDDGGEESIAAATEEAADTAGEETSTTEAFALVPPVEEESAYLVEAGTSVEQIVEDYAGEALDVAFSYCYTSGAIDDLVEEQAPSELVGMIPVSIGDELFEVLLFSDANGRAFGVARTADCADPLS